jgi:diaminohydroxyphosphoribosylaminopyrimidine deaminase/5-amino-6-(5-phosphoribosylamino)uracil reductase
MRRALELAVRAEGETNPNPMVGCVIVRGGRVLAEGYHARAGAPHAEVVALERAGARARGATLYVNLEPCSHQGRTPPCAPRLVAAGVRRVVVAMSDPNPRVHGRGLALLRRQGLRVSCGLLQREARLLNERFVVSIERRRPFVLLKAALTLDGRIATAAGRSKWLTNARQRAAARELRRLHDAVLVGVGTILADDPVLLPRPALRRPFYRIVLDSSYRTPLGSRLVRSARRSPVIVVGLGGQSSRRRALESAGVTVLRTPAVSGRVSLKALLGALWKRGLTSVMVEGGSEVLGAFLAQRLVDQVALFRAPLLMGGRESLSAFGGPSPARVDEALRLTRANRVAGDTAAPEIWYPLKAGRSVRRR